MAPNIVTTNVEQRSLTTVSSDDNIGNVIAQEKHSWFQSLWPKRWSLNLNIPLLKKHRKKPHNEQPKVAISRSPKRWLLPIMIHVIPIVAGIAIAAINLKGYFVGTQFVGVTDPRGQSTALFSLQVTAKVLEIFVIGSLGFIVLDVVHYFLLFDDAGLPFSLAGARLTFNDLSYLASPAFWSGINALRSFSLQITVAFLLVSCGILATFIGPAAALLLIPSNNPVWPAGGLRFILPQSELEIWPPQLNGSHVGPSSCVDPSEVTAVVPTFENNDCLWYAGQLVSSNALYGPLTTVGSFSVFDYTSSRDLSWTFYGVKGTSQAIGITSSTIWAWSGTSIANIMSSSLYADWLWAAGDEALETRPTPPEALPLPYGRYPFRDPLGDQMMLPGMQAPSARAYCLGSKQSFGGMATLSYPVIPATGSYITDTNATFLIPSSLLQNTSIVRTFWTPKPATNPEIQGGEADKGDTVQLPSALLIIQIPTESESFGFVFTCSVDARWITNATQLLQTYDDQRPRTTAGVPITYTQIGSATFDTQGRPATSEISSMLDLDISWLEQLTPTFNETLPGTNISRVSPGHTTMAKSISSSPIKEILEDGAEISTIIEPFQLLIALLVVDGMARANSYTFQSWPVAAQWAYESNISRDPHVLLAGAGGTNSLPRNASEMFYPEYLWSISISGYAYAIESTGDILALMILFVYMFFALGHIYFILHKRWYSVDWWSVADMIALSQNSPPSDLLKNTSGGIEVTSTSRLLLKLRAPDVPLGDRETIQVLVCRDKSDLGYRRPSDYHKIEKEKAYY